MKPRPTECWLCGHVHDRAIMRPIGKGDYLCAKCMEELERRAAEPPETWIPLEDVMHRLDQTPRDQ